jgi:hypothetical protein
MCVDQAIHEGSQGPSEYHWRTVDFLPKREGYAYPGTVWLIDPDMFLFAPFPWEEVLPPGYVHFDVSHSGS